MVAWGRFAVLENLARFVALIGALVFVHEFGHHMGLDEDGLHRFGWG